MEKGLLTSKIYKQTKIDNIKICLELSDFMSLFLFIHSIYEKYKYIHWIMN